MPEYFAVDKEGGEAPKVVVRFRIIRKRDSNFFAASIGLRIETTDFYLIRAQKDGSVSGLRPQLNSSRTYREITRSRDSEIKPGARSTRRRNSFVGLIVRGGVDFG